MSLETIMALIAVAVLFLIILVLVGDVIITRAKAAREALARQAAEERAREADLLARYKRTLSEIAVDIDALQAELDAEFGPLPIDKAARLSA